MKKRGLGSLIAVSGLCVSIIGCGPREIAVDFKKGVMRDRVDTINAQIGSVVIDPPVLKSSNLYLMGLSFAVTWDAAASFYEAQPEVAGVLPALSYSP
jgi:hypothetical protein